jgi:predicted transcriptional regulator
MSSKLSDRRKYNPNGDNEYTTPKEKPPRLDLRKRHEVITDPLDIADKKNEEKDMKISEIMDSKEIAKKVARKMMAAKKEDDNHQREGLEGFKFKDKGIRSIATTYKSLAESFMLLSKASNIFTSCKSSEISPDGKMGGKGYVLSIKDIRTLMAQTLNIMSELVDTFHDEVNSPYWKKTTVEDNPIVKELLSEADT